LGLSRPPVSRFGGQNKNFSVSCVLFSLEIIIFYNFHESFHLGQKRGTKRQKKEEELWPPQPPVLWLRSPVLVMGGLKDMWEKEGQKGLKEPWA
jgi:hypothetical protein